ncbi:MFS transporter [Streptomyces sp. NPDC005438]|uniref:MFS transporter n=1 Tax=Streptomyces sp. NPDC005438 TaxID=3156880 RepID=UPI0033B8A58B
MSLPPGATAAEGTRTPRTLRPMVGVLVAMATSLTATRVSTVALPWFVLVTTHSAAWTGLVAFCEMAPYVLVKLLAGPVVDRIGTRRVSWVADLVSAVVALAIPLLHLAQLLALPVLLGLVALIGAARGPGDVAKEVMVPVAAEYGRLPLERATGLSGAVERLALTVGLAAGGALVALVGPLASLTVNAGCFALGSLVVRLTLPRDGAATVEGAEAATAAEERSGYRGRLREGFTFLRTDTLLWAVVVMVGVTNLLDAAFGAVLIPLWARSSGNGPAVIGLVGGVMGAAAIAGSLLAAGIAHRLPRRMVFFGGFLVAGAPRFVVLALGAPLPVVLAVFALGGFGAGFLNPIIGSLAFERVPRRMWARVNALGDSIAWAGVPLGGLLAGAAVGFVGLVPVLWAGGAVYAATTGLTGLRREWREMDRDRRRGRGKGAGTGMNPALAPSGEPAGPPHLESVGKGRRGASPSSRGD